MESMDHRSPRPRLLLVDDNEDGVEALSILLGAKYNVFAYTRAEKAREAIETSKPDVVVLDIAMHPIDGLECLKAIRAMPGRHDVPAIALTGYARSVERERFLEGGFQAVVAKPVADFARLVTLIDELLLASAGLAQASPASAPEPGAVTMGDAARFDCRAATGALEAGGARETDGRRPARSAENSR
jgi:CheY-like chemotaxis protein